ncbi:putative Ig lambda chain protein [Naja naja]|nr:putative Ig lambda chain protein [Naja naja]
MEGGADVISSGVETTKASKQGDKYLASSYLKLTAAQYEKYESFTAEVTHESQPTVSPSVQVFAPSQEEIRSPNPYTVVCLLTDFYPAAFNLQWKGGADVISSGVETTKASRQGDKYLASSYLKLTAAQYEKYESFTCEVTHESQPTVSPSVQVFAPSQEEIRSPNPYTVVCLLTDFYPAAFNLQWKGGADVISSGVETTKASRQGDKYLASSYLKLTAAQYEKYESFTCEVTHESQPTVSPSVQVFAPSQEEIRSPNPYTVVCLLTDFYPAAFNLQWKGGADVISSGVETTKASRQGDKYLASSYLKLTAAQYEKYESFTCEVTHESKKISKTVSKSGSC